MTTQKVKYPKENLMFAGILALVVCALIITAIIKNNQSRDLDVYSKATTALTNNVCPGCGQWGTPACPYCRFNMQWNNAQGIYVCPRCRAQGAPYCPGCRRPVLMQAPGTIGCLPPQPPAFTQPRFIPQQTGAALAA